MAWPTFALALAGERDRVPHRPRRLLRRRVDGHGGRDADGDRLGRRAAQAGGVGHAQAHVHVAAPGVGPHGRRERRVVVRAVAVEVPRVGERAVLGVARAAAVEVHGQRRLLRVRRGRDARRRRAVGDAADRVAAEVGVVERVVRPLGQEHRPGRAAREQPALPGIGLPVGAERHEPDAVARVVAEEEPAAVGRREGRAGVEADGGDRGVARGAAVAVDDVGRVVVREGRRRRGALRVQRLAGRHVERVIARLAAGALVARPAVVADGAVDRDAVELLPRRPAHVAQPDVVRARPEGEAEGVAEAVGDDVRAIDHRVVRVQAQDRAVGREGLFERAPERLRAQRAALGVGRPDRAARVRRVGAHVADLAEVRVVEVRALARAHVEHPVRAERSEPTEWLGNCWQKSEISTVLAAGRVDPREPPVDRAAQPAGAAVRAGVAPPGVMRVRDEHAAVGRDRHPQQPAVPVVLHLRAQVGEHGRRRVVDAVERVDPPALRGHVHAPTGREPHHRRIDEARPHRRLTEPGRQLRRRPRRRHAHGDQQHGEQQGPAHARTVGTAA